MKKFSLIGAGNIGGCLASLIALKNLGNITLVDIVEGTARGKALDLSQSLGLLNSSITINGTKDLKNIKNSDVIIVTAGIARKPGMSRDDLIETNFNIMKKIGISIKKYSPSAFVICVTNPLDAMVWTLKKISGLKKNMIVGMAGILDTERFKFFLSKELNVSTQNIDAMVLGGHGDTMVPLLGYTTVSGISVSELIKKGFLSMKKFEEIIQRTRSGGGEIVKLMVNSSAFFAPAASAIEIAESYLNNQKKLLPCSTYLNGEFGVINLFIGVPVIIGKNGVEKVIELRFNKKEEMNFKESVKAVKELTDKCKKLLE